MGKDEFIFYFLSKKLVVVLFGKEIGVFKKDDQYADTIYLPSSWYFEAIKIYNNQRQATASKSHEYTIETSADTARRML
jgi:hypothetical protein